MNSEANKTKKEIKETVKKIIKSELNGTVDIKNKSRLSIKNKNRFELFGMIILNYNVAMCSKFPDYLFFNRGLIYSLKRKTFIKQQETKNGYKFVYLANNNNYITIYTHRLMYLIFKGDIDEGMEINHINHIRDFNFIGNLECVSIRDNRIKRVYNKQSIYYNMDREANIKNKNYFKKYNLLSKEIKLLNNINLF